MTITEFLLARIAEDEAAAKAATQGPWTARPGGFIHNIEVGGPEYANDPESLTLYAEADRDSDWIWNAEHMARHNPIRVLAECAAKRAIIAGRKRSDSSMADDEWTMGWSDGNYDALRALAAVYADHPDYLPEWAR